MPGRPESGVANSRLEAERGKSVTWEAERNKTLIWEAERGQGAEVCSSNGAYQGGWVRSPRYPPRD